jgi:hypothetical protein
MKFLKLEYTLDIITGKGVVIQYLSRRERRNQNRYVSPGVYTVEFDMSEIHVMDQELQPIIIEREFAPRQGIMTRYAQKMVDPRYYTTVKIENNNNRFV